MLENGALSAGRFHDLMFKALVGITFCLGMVNAIPVQAETFVRYHSRYSRLDPNHIVYYVDLDTIEKNGKYTFFRTRKNFYKVDSDNIPTRQLESTKISPLLGVADCRNVMIAETSLLPLYDLTRWNYRQSNGEWWLQFEVVDGNRNITPRSKRWLKLLGVTSDYELRKTRDELFETLFRIVCAKHEYL